MTYVFILPPIRDFNKRGQYRFNILYTNIDTNKINNGNNQNNTLCENTGK